MDTSEKGTQLPYYNSISQIYDFVNTKCEVYVNNGRNFCIFCKTKEKTIQNIIFFRKILKKVLQKEKKCDILCKV